MTAFAITLGSIFSLLAYDLLGLAAGGIVVPGYLALELDRPGRVTGLILVAVLTHGVNGLMGQYLLLFGRRQLVTSVLVGCLLAQGLRAQGLRSVLSALPAAETAFAAPGGDVGLEAMGWVIPGLIAYWCGRQGTLRTLSALLLTSAMVRLALITVAGWV